MLSTSVRPSKPVGPQSVLLLRLIVFWFFFYDEHISFSLSISLFMMRIYPFHLVFLLLWWANIRFTLYHLDTVLEISNSPSTSSATFQFHFFFQFLYNTRSEREMCHCWWWKGWWQSWFQAKWTGNEKGDWSQWICSNGNSCHLPFWSAPSVLYYRPSSPLSSQLYHHQEGEATQT